MSLHRYIVFSLETSSSQQIAGQTSRLQGWAVGKLNRGNLHEALHKHLKVDSWIPGESPELLHSNPTNWFIVVSDVSMPRRSGPARRPLVPWWSESIATIIKEVYKYRRIYKREKRRVKESQCKAERETFKSRRK